MAFRATCPEMAQKSPPKASRARMRVCELTRGRVQVCEPECAHPRE